MFVLISFGKYCVIVKVCNGFSCWFCFFFLDFDICKKNLFVVLLCWLHNFFFFFTALDSLQGVFFQVISS